MNDIKTIAEKVDQYVNTREARLALDRQSDALKEQETELKAAIMAALQEAKSRGIAGTTHRITLRTKSVPVVKDWLQLYAYMAENNAWELMQRRISPPAIVERWEADEAIPGVEAMEVTDISLNKL